MKLIFVSGMDDIDRATMIDLALQRSGRKESFTFIDLEKMHDVGSEIGEVEELEVARRMVDVFHERTEKAMITRLKEHRGDMVVNGCLTFRTRHGYLRSFPDDFFRSFKPDSIVILEKEDASEEALEHQRINRYYGTICSSLSGSALKIIRFREKKMMDAVRELSEVLKH